MFLSSSGDTASCLHNAPHEDEALGRQLPGTLLSLDAQCRRDRGTSACFKDERVCAQLFCFDAASGYCVAYRPAAEGSTCGDGQVRQARIIIQLNINCFPLSSTVSTESVFKRTRTLSPTTRSTLHPTSVQTHSIHSSSEYNSFISPGY